MDSNFQPASRTETLLYRAATGTGTILSPLINRKEILLGAVCDRLDSKADLVDGKVPSSQLPSYIDDVLEYNNLASFPATGETGKIYVALDTNKTYRWSGTTYISIGGGLEYEEV